MITRSEIVSAFARLGHEMAAGRFPGKDVVAGACRANGWFTPEEIRRATAAVASQMLDPGRLARWSGRYPLSGRHRKVAVVMAGNIPLAGLFDMLCVLVSGHRCLAKYSSKDRVLMVTVSGWLKSSLPGLPLDEYTGGEADAVIASGSDNAIRHLRAKFGGVPAVYRGNRSSAAILDGRETDEEFAALAGDIFSYSGLGCRNVSHLLLPVGYDPGRLAALPRTGPNPKYLNNYRQRRAVLTLSRTPFTDCGTWLLRPDEAFPAILSEVTYHFYTTPEEALAWVADHEHELQCVVADGGWSERMPFPATGFGKAQSPGLDDYPDRVDTMEFLSEL